MATASLGTVTEYTTGGGSWVNKTTNQSTNDGDNNRYYLGTSSGSNYRARFTLTVPSSINSKATVTKLVVKIKADSAATPKYMRGFLTTTNHADGNYENVTGSGKYDEISYLWLNESKSSRATAYQSSGGVDCYLVFDEGGYTPGKTYYVHILPYDSDSAANGSPTFSNTWWRGRNQSGYYSATCTYFNPYTITYNDNGGSGGPGSETKIHGTDYVISSTKPTRSGYTFLGWGTSASTTTVSYKSGDKYTSDSAITLYAIWSKTITVTYNANGGGGAPDPESKTVYNSTTSATFTLKAAPTTSKSGYVFNGWSTSSSSTSGDAVGTTKTFSSSTTLYAAWKINTGKVTIDGSNYGTVKDANGNSIASGSSVSYGTVLTITPTAATGYTTTAKVSTGSISNNKYTVNSDVTITFTRTENTYYVYYENGLATSGTLPKTTSRTYTKNATIGTNSMSKTATEADSYAVTYKMGNATGGTTPSTQTSKNTTTYTANGWTTGSSNTNDRDYDNGTSYGANTTNNLTLYPNFSTTVTNNGVTTSSNTMTRSNGTADGYTLTYKQGTATSTTIPDPQTAKDTITYSHSGWATSQNGTQAYGKGAKTGSLSSNLTLYPYFTQSVSTRGSVKLSSNTMIKETVVNKTYTITFNPDGGTVSKTTDTADNKTSYAANGWTTTSGSTSRTYTNGASVQLTQNITVYPCFTQTTTTDAIDLPTPSKTNFTFNGWYTSTGTSVGKTTYTPSGNTTNITLTARWTRNAYTVSFNSQGGTTVDNKTVSTSSPYISPLPTTTRTGYTFQGWYNTSASSGGTKLNTGTRISSDVTYYARWTANTYQIRFNAEGGSGTMANQSFTYDGGNKTLSANTFTKTGYVFQGWSTYSGSTTVDYQDKATINNLTADNNDIIDFYAVWKRGVYTMTIEANGGTLLGNNTTNNIVTKFAYDTRTYVGKKQSTTYSVSTGTSSRITFTKNQTLYYADSYKDPATTNGTLELQNPIQLTITVDNCNNSLKGKYVSYNSNIYFIPSSATFTGYSWSNTITCSAASVCSITTSTIDSWNSDNSAFKQDWVFTGYTTNLSGSSVTKNTSGASFYFDGGCSDNYDDYESSSNTYVFDGKATSDVIITAQFRRKQYTITYEANNKNLVLTWPDTDCEYGIQQTLNTASDTPVYEFLGWNTKANGTGTMYSSGETILNLTDEDGAVITLYAQWKLKNLVKLHTGSSFENAQVYIWERDETGEAKWRLATTYIYVNDNDRWKMSTGN